MTEADGGQRWSDDSHSCITSVQSDRVRLEGYKNARRSMSPFQELWWTQKKEQCGAIFTCCLTTLLKKHTLSDWGLR